MYTYVRGRQLEGTYSDDPRVGTWPITDLRIRRGWGVPTDADWPYQGDARSWPPVEPRGIDQLAKPNRIWSYQRIRNLDACKSALASQNPVVVAFDVVLVDWSGAQAGVIAMPQQKPTASHTVVIVGYNDETRRLTIRNSWGVDWGDQGYGTLPYDFFDRYMREAWVIGAARAHEDSDGPGLVELEWGMPDVFGDVLHGVEIYNPSSDERIAWAFAVRADDYLEVEELFVRPDARRRGFATALAKLLQARSDRIGVALRLWLPHVDASGDNLRIVAHLSTQLGFRLDNSPTRWASYVIA